MQFHASRGGGTTVNPRTLHHNTAALRIRHPEAGIEAGEGTPAPYTNTSLEDSLRSGKPLSQAREKKE